MYFNACCSGDQAFIKFASLVIIVHACSGGSRGYKFQKGESPPRLVQFYAVLYYFMGEILHRNLSGNCMLKNCPFYVINSDEGGYCTPGADPGGVQVVRTPPRAPFLKKILWLFFPQYNKGAFDLG